MKLNRITHAEFITLMEDKGIKICHITRKMIYLVEEDKSKYWWPKMITPVPINMNKKYEDIFQQPIMPLHEAIGGHWKLYAIKNIRTQTGMGLKDAKDFVEVNFFNQPIPA